MESQIKDLEHRLQVVSWGRSKEVPWWAAMPSSLSNHVFLNLEEEKKASVPSGAPEAFIVTATGRYDDKYHIWSHKVGAQNNTAYPIWVRDRRDGVTWLFSSPNGRWIFGDLIESPMNFMCETGAYVSKRRHSDGAH
jgi:hypothetical protein